MLLSAVILVLQETLEIVLLISVLMAVSYKVRNEMSWMPVGLVAGCILSVMLAANTDIISVWFDYVGQEVVNALLQTLIAFVIVIFSWSTFSNRQAGQSDNLSRSRRLALLFQLSATVATALTITREGSEILLYLGGFFQQEDLMRTMVIGSGIGFSIGVSVGVLLFYGLTGLPGRWGLATALTLLALFAGNMLSQSVQQLTQADWLPSFQPFWDTSEWMPENSVTGQLLYALIGYEATPSVIQVTSYIAGALLVGIVAINARRLESRPAQLK